MDVYALLVLFINSSDALSYVYIPILVRLSLQDCFYLNHSHKLMGVYYMIYVEITQIMLYTR